VYLVCKGVFSVRKSLDRRRVVVETKVTSFQKQGQCSVWATVPGSVWTLFNLPISPSFQFFDVDEKTFSTLLSLWEPSLSFPGFGPRQLVLTWSRKKRRPAFFPPTQGQRDLRRREGEKSGDNVCEVISNNVGAGCLGQPGFLLSRLRISISPTPWLRARDLLKVVIGTVQTSAGDRATADSHWTHTSNATTSKACDIFYSSGVLETHRHMLSVVLKRWLCLVLDPCDNKVFKKRCITHRAKHKRPVVSRSTPFLSWLDFVGFLLWAHKLWAHVTCLLIAQFCGSDFEYIPEPGRFAKNANCQNLH